MSLFVKRAQYARGGAVVVFAVVAAAGQGVLGANTSWVKVGQSGRLMYGMDGAGDRILDFSESGYMGGGVALPVYSNVVTPDRVVTVSPAAGGADSLTAIQAAINAVAAKPLNANGFRGVVQLSAGTFNISNSIKITSSGIILRGMGSGAGAGSTALAYTGTSQINMVQVDSSNSRSTNTTHSITDKVVPAGATSFHVDVPGAYKVGDRVLIHRPSTATWIHDLGMDAIPPRSDGSTVQWAPGSKNEDLERTITHIDSVNGTIQLDAGLPDSLTQNYGGGTISKYTWNRTNNVGIENLRGDGFASYVPGVTSATDENHAKTFVYVQDTQNAWVKNVVGTHLVYATVQAATGSKFVTVDGATSMVPVSQITGGRRYPFDIEGQFVLMENLNSDNGRHEFVNNSPSRGPNVFLNGVATNGHADSGPHQRWSVGTLYDNLTTNTSIDVQNRGNSGTGHGWAGANMVIWNSSAKNFYVQNPQTSENWIIGSTGTVHSTSQFTSGSFPSYADANNTGSKVTLNVNGTAYTSLYQAQLAQKAANPKEQLREYVVGDYDGFVNDGASDNVAVDAAWKGKVTAASALPQVGFDRTDATSSNVPFTFSYELGAKEQVTSAVLTLAVETLGGNSASEKLFIEDMANGIALSTLSSQHFGSSDIYQIEFLAGSATDALSFLQDGKLNLDVSANHAVDWANLQLEVAPLPTPEAGTAALVAAGLAAMMIRRRREVSRAE
ncbi:MAG: hypothetical protein ACTHN5_21975 [Phycisphaerae bacterium]